MTEITEFSIDGVMAAFLVARCGLPAAEQERFAALVMSLFSALRDGHSCICLDEDDRLLAQTTRVVSNGPPAPLVLVGRRLYLYRHFRYEVRLAENLRSMAIAQLPAVKLDGWLKHWFPDTGDQPDWQKEAAKLAASGRLTIISGGPGTGKTTTIGKTIGVLLCCHGDRLRIGVTAPTGKAAFRLQESLQDPRTISLLPVTLRPFFPDRAETVHRLLGARRFSSVFRFNRSNPLPWDVVIVDEASMIDLELMGKLVDALKGDARLILVGDKDQLAAVESGAVLNDCIQALPERVVVLRKRWRFDRKIALFADAVNRGDADSAFELLDSPGSAVISAEGNWLESIGQRYRSFLDAVAQSTSIGAYQSLFGVFGRFRVLSALRHGRMGAQGLNLSVERYLAGQGYDCVYHQWYVGRPVMITQNDYSRGLFNGDIGLCLPETDDSENLAIWFERPDGSLRSLTPGNMPNCVTAWATTIHKSQGSEFEEVVIILPGADNPILSRELLYTGVTRASKRVTIVAERSAIRAAISHRTVRSGGLVERLQQSRNQMEHRDDTFPS